MTAPEKSASGEHRVELRNRGATLEVDEDETILDAAEAAGHTLPVGCREGRCITCAARLLRGKVVHSDAATALRPEQEERGYVLLCVARARSDVVLEVGRESQRELFRNPFRRPRPDRNDSAGSVEG